MKKKTISIIAAFAFVITVVTLLITTLAYAHSAPAVWSVQITTTPQATTTPEQPAYPPPNCENHAPYPPPSIELYSYDYFPLMFKIEQFVDEIFGER